MVTRWAHPLFVLLPLFVVVGLLTLFMQVYTGRVSLHGGAEAATPHGPAEFPEVLTFEPTLDAEGGGDVRAGPPARTEDYWPCSECHEPDDYDPKRRKLTQAHEEIVLKHDEENRWCLDCHDAVDRDRLRLAGGDKVSFDESERLCGQCHGTIYRDWKAGIHGKRTGNWDGPKRYLLCVNCHSPHAPRFRPVEPLPPPVRPGLLRRPEVPAGSESPAPTGDDGHEEGGG